MDSTARHVVDAVGAGDALLAYSALALKTTGNELIAAILGCMAAGLECEVDGNQPITPVMMHDAIAMVESWANYLPHRAQA
jgi:sugar/nucleoside kinase (ribokinase family)